MDSSTIVFLIALAVVVITIGVLLNLARRQSALRHGEPEGRLSKAAGAFGAALRGAWGSGIDSTTWDQLEEALLAGDVGVESTDEIVSGVKNGRPEDGDAARRLLEVELGKALAGRDRVLRVDGNPAVILVVGVNGTGKTTTIAKLGSRLASEGSKVLFAAADTFRAAAGEQLKTWGSRVGIDVVGGQEGGDPASVVFDALEAARARSVDVVIVDTAGRLHGKKNLMAELEKIHRVATSGGDLNEVLLVLDATAGQNGLTQVSEFSRAVPLTGIVLTKLDGTARGGIVIAIERNLGVPVKLIGLGEGVEDLEPFDPDQFVRELLEQS
jgi:fused signal recognition particle receptor